MIDWRAALRRPREVYARTRHQLHQAREVARGLSLDVAASTEVRQATLRALAEIDARLDVAEAAFADRIADVLVERPSLADTFVRRLVGGSVDDLTNGVAELLTFEHGANSFQSQAGLWVNSPLIVGYEPGRVFVHAVSERIVEVPYALAAALTLPRRARVVDVGACDSTTALSLASFGYATTALDTRPYALAHPNLSVVTADMLTWEPDVTFDAALCVSTVEHVGLGWYGDPLQADGDRLALERVRAWLRPGGLLVLTVPFGTAAAADHQRSYDGESLEKLLDGWEVTDRQFFVRGDDGTWSPHDGSAWAGVGVALVTALRPTNTE